MQSGLSQGGVLDVAHSLRNLFKELGAADHGVGSTFAALGLVALVPAVCVLWFMTVAMRNERLAVQDRLTDVYLTHVASLQRQLIAFWEQRQAALSSLGRNAPAQRFAAVVRSNLADSAVVYDGSRKVIYPAPESIYASEEEENALILARELEFQKSDYPAAITAYERIAQSTQDPRLKARAWQAQAACLLKAGQRKEALDRLAELADDPRLRNAISAQGTLIVPNVQLMILRVATSTDALRHDPSTLRQRTLDDLVKRLNNYTDPDFRSSQRRFLMREVTALAPQAAAFPSLAAEELAAEYVESASTIPTEPALRRTPLAKVWQLPVAGGSLVALFREERLRLEMTALLGSITLSDLRVTVLPPGESFTSGIPVAPQEAGRFLPGWRLGLSFKESDTFAAMSARQTRLYLWTGFLVVLIIAMMSLLVARYVAAQMRLARVKNELVSMISHELKTPLSSMRALVETLLARRYHDEAQLTAYLNLMAHENQRLSHLIGNFLTFSRLERDKQRFRFEAVRVETIVSNAVSVLQDRIISADCRFETEIAPGLPAIHGDPEALTSVLINLLDNACKYTPRDKHIVVSAHLDHRALALEVRDNGIGLTRAEARRVFDRFYQVDQSLSRQTGGCGLGLSIVQSIVKAHGGSVAVSSEPGKGSTFTISLPLAGSLDPGKSD